MPLPSPRALARVAATLPLLLLAPAAVAQAPRLPAPETVPVRVNRANWTLAERFGTDAMRTAVYSTGVQPRWLGETDSLWYNWRDRTGSRFYLVVPQARVKRPLFDHAKVAAALSETHRKAYEPQNLPFTTLDFTKDHRRIRFTVDTVRYEWHLQDETLRSLGKPSRDTVPVDEERARGQGGGNGTGGGNQDWRNYAPDSTLFAFARDHDLYVVDAKSGDTTKVSADGEKNRSFGWRDTTQVQQQQQQQQDDDDDGERQRRSRDPRVRPNVVWSPDSRAFAVVRNDARKVRELYLVNVLAEPRPTLSSYTYAMPGEENVSQPELWVWRRGEGALRQLDVRRYKDQRLLNVHWTVGSDVVRLVRRDRLQRNLELVEVALATGAVKRLLTESVENAYLETQPVRYVKPGGDMLWWSERSGWGHVYLYAHDGTFKRALTSGPWRVDAIADVDSVRGVVYLAGVGREEGENPYYRHLYRVNADGSGLASLPTASVDPSSRARACSTSRASGESPRARLVGSVERSAST
jgi:hypothetical protein